MQRRTRLTPLGFTLTLALALALGTTTGAAAEERSFFDVTPAGASSKTRPIFGAAAAQATTATTPPNDHQFGVGVRIGGTNFGIGGSVRYFFYAGPLGVQAEVSHHGVDFGLGDFDSIQFAPSAIYRFREIQLEAPVSLTPYAGIGLSFIHSDFGGGVLQGVDDTDVGILLYGGVEVFFERVPNLGASGQLSYNSNDEVISSGFGSDLGGVAFTAAAHWYFW